MPSASTTAQPPEISQSLPSEVVKCLENARFLHLATCHNETPHVSLMNYTYLPSTPFRNEPTIIMTSLPSSRKAEDLFHNPRVSIVVHDWVTHRPPTLTSSAEAAERSASPERLTGLSSLATLLQGMNSASLARNSVSLNGTAEILESSSEEETWCRAKHRELNTFEDSNATGGVIQDSSAEGDGGAGFYIECQGIRVIVVKIKDGRISDWKGNVKDWVLDNGRPNGQVNGTQAH